MQNLFGSVLVPTWQQNRRCWRTEQEVDGRNGSMDNNDFSNFVLIFYMVFAVLVLIFHRINHVQEALGRMFQNKYIHACSLINFFFPHCSINILGTDRDESISNNPSAANKGVPNDRSYY